MESITYNLVCFLDNADFARYFVKYLPSRDFTRLIFVHKKFNPMSIIKQDYKELYLAFICQREKYYPLIFSFHFRCHDIDTLSEYLANETIKNLKLNQPMVYIPDQMRNFNPHDKKIREILYQCFSLYLSKPIQIVGEDGAISFDEVGSVAYSDLVINEDGKWVCDFKDGIYYNPEEESRYNENEELDPLGFYNDSFMYLETCGIYEISINSLFVLLHKFDIKLKHKLIVDRIVISPFEQEIHAMDLHEKICNKFLFPHHMNCLYGNIEDNLELITRLDMKRFYSLISAISTGILPDVKDKDAYNCVNTYLLGDDINIYRGMFSDNSWSNDVPYVNCLVQHFTYNYDQQDLQPHLKTKKYNTAHLLDYIDTYDA